MNDKLAKIQKPFVAAAKEYLEKARELQLAAGIAHPKEWYIVPYKIIEEAVSRLIQGEKLGYDSCLQKLISEN